MQKIKFLFRAILPMAVALLTLGSCAKTQDVDNLKTQVSTIEQNLSDAIKSTEGQLAQLNQAVAAAATQTEVNAIKESIKAVEERLKALSELSTQLEEVKASTGDNTNAIASIQKALEYINGNVAISIMAPGFEPTEIVVLPYAEWNPSDDAAFRTIAEAFPVLKDREKGSITSLSGYANVIVNPGNVDFNRYRCSLVDKFGESAEGLMYSMPEKGFDTKGNAGFWKVGVRALSPNLEKFTELQGPFSLQAQKMPTVGAPQEYYEYNIDFVANTDFRYYVQAVDCSDIDVEVVAQNDTDSAVAFYANSICVTEPVSPELGIGAIATVRNGYEDYFTVALADDDDTQDMAEKYDISCEDGYIRIGKNVDRDTVNFNINVTAVGLNGKAVTKKINVSIGAPLARKMKDLELSYEPSDVAPVEFRWKISDMGLSNEALSYLLDCKWKYSIEHEQFNLVDNVKFYSETGAEVSKSDAVYFGFDVDGILVATRKCSVYLTIYDLDAAVYADMAYSTIYGKVEKSWMYKDALYALWDIKAFYSDFWPLEYKKWNFSYKTDVSEAGMVLGIFLDTTKAPTSVAEGIAYVGASIDAEKTGEYPVTIYAKDENGSTVYYKSSVVVYGRLSTVRAETDTVGDVTFYWTKEDVADLFGNCLNSEHWYFDVKMPESSFIGSYAGDLRLLDSGLKGTEDRTKAEYVYITIVKDMLAKGPYEFTLYSKNKSVIDWANKVSVFVNFDAEGKVMLLPAN